MSNVQPDDICPCNLVWRFDAHFKRHDIKYDLEFQRRQLCVIPYTASSGRATWRRWTRIKKLKQELGELDKQRAVWAEIERKAIEENEYTDGMEEDTHQKSILEAYGTDYEGLKRGWQGSDGDFRRSLRQTVKKLELHEERKLRNRKTDEQSCSQRGNEPRDQSFGSRVQGGLEAECNEKR